MTGIVTLALEAPVLFHFAPTTMKDFGEGQNRLNSRNERYFFDFGLHFGIQFSFAHCFHSPSKDELFFALLEVGTDFCGEVFLDPCYHRSSLHSSREESLKN